MKEKLLDPKVKYGLILFHVLCSFLWASRVFKNIGLIAIQSKVVQPIVSDRFENVLAYLLSEGLAILIIWCFWQLLFYVLRNFKKSYLLFGLLFLAGTIFILLAWPGVFEVSADNFITYSGAVRLTPDYWHNAYSSYVYAASLLFFPADFMIVIVQWAFFLFSLAYTFERLGKLAPKMRYLIFLIFLLPHTYQIMTDSYRIFQYAIIVLLFVSIVMIDIVERRQRSLKEYAALAALGAFLSVWRLEGAVFCSAFFLAHVFCTHKGTFWSKVRRLLLFAVCFGLILIPQKIGEIKYYGRDYQIMNTLYPLRSFFLYPEMNLSYEGAEADKAALDAVVPIALIKQYGIEGYHRYNYNVKGNIDFNQSLATDEESKAYVKAYYNILLHNPGNTLKYLWDNVAYAFSGRRLYFWLYEVPPEEQVAIGPRGSEIWDFTKFDMYSNGHTAWWMEKTGPLQLNPKCLSFFMKYQNFCFTKKVYYYMFFVIMALHLSNFLVGLYRLIRKKDMGSFFFGLIGLAMIAEYVALLLVAPVPAVIYFMIANYVSIALLFYTVLFYAKKKGLEAN